VSLEEPKPHCTTCGLPLKTQTCRACGGSAAPIALLDGVASAASAYAPDPGRPELELAFDAWQAGDFGRLVSHCFAALGVTEITTQQGAEGPGFKAMFRRLALFVRINATSGAIIVEAPVVRLPLTQYIPALRLILELSDRDGSPTRFSARGDLVMARFVGRIGAMTPSTVCKAIEWVADATRDGSRLLIGALQARELSGDELRMFGVDALPRGVTLSEELPSSSLPQSPKKGPGSSGMFEAMPPLLDHAPQARPTPVAEIPAVLMPPGGISVAPQPRAKVLTPARLPDRRSPMGGEVGRAPTVPQRPAVKPPGPPPPPRGAPTPVAPTAATRGLQPPPRSAPPPPPGAVQRTMVSAEAMAKTQSSAPPTDPLADTFITEGIGANAPPKTGSPADGLCELLHRAQTLGAVLSFADQPTTMCLLIRATTYRAVFEHDAAAPSAVAFLFASTLPMTREIYITAPGKRRGSMAIPPTSPAFEAMARVVAQRGEIDAPEPLAVQPITTAQEAKQHLARYVSEIDQAPSDLELRHFLALGALSELLVRTKLPAATQERLRGIIGHARKEGAKQPVVELMMTALTRMIA
jgi:hypothetical protein